MAAREPDKNPGKLLTSLYDGAASALERMLAVFGKQRTTQPVPLGTPPDTVTGPIVESQVTRTRTDELDRQTISFSDGDSTHTYTDTKLTREFGGSTVDVIMLETDVEPTVDSGLQILESKVERVGPSIWLKTTEEIISFPVLFSYDRDPFKNNRLITTEVTTVNASFGLPSPGTGAELFIIYSDAWRSVFKIKTYENPTPYAEFRHGAQVMPALWNSTDSTTYSWSDACGAFSNIRGEKPMLTLSYVYHEWFDASLGPLTPQPCVDILPVVLILGRGWQYGSPLLCDAYVFTYTGGCTAAFAFPSSSPSYTTYTTTIQNAPGTATIPSRVSEEVTLDNGYYWHRQTLYMYYK